MNPQQFVECGKEILEFLGDHRDNIAKLNVVPAWESGCLRQFFPDDAPFKGVNFKDVIDEVKTKIVPGMVHYHHPNFYANFPLGNSYPSVLGELLTAGFGGLAFSWITSPVYTELETIVLEWLAKAINLPLDLFSGNGGGVMQGSASEAVLVCLITARDRAISELKDKSVGDIDESVFLSKLVVYASSLSPQSVEKAAKISLVKLRILDVDSHGRLDSAKLRKAIQTDKDLGLTPFFVVGTVGTFSVCSFDNLQEIGHVCKETPSIWFHVDGAYAGTTFILPEMRQFQKGLELADSFITNPHNHMLLTFDACCMFVKDVESLKKAMTVEATYLKHQKDGINYRNFSLGLSRRCRALKLWIVLRTYGIGGIRRYMRNHNVLAKRFEKHVRADERFEVVNEVHLGLVCFRLNDTDPVNQALLHRINQSGKYHMAPAMFLGKFIIRFCLTYEHANEEHIDNAWDMIQNTATNVLRNINGEEKRSICCCCQIS